MNQKSLLGWIAITITLSVIAFGGGFYLGQNWQKGNKPESASPPWITKNLPPPPPPTEETIPEQRLTFYDKLTETPGKAPKTSKTESARVQGSKEPPATKEKIESPPRPSTTRSAKEESPPPSTQGNYVIHIASLKSQQGAESEAAQLNKKGYKVKVVAVDLGEKGKWYRLLMVGYTSKEEAERTAETLRKKEGLSPLVRAGKE